MSVLVPMPGKKVGKLAKTVMHEARLVACLVSEICTNPNPMFLLED